MAQQFCFEIYWPLATKMRSGMYPFRSCEWGKIANKLSPCKIWSKCSFVHFYIVLCKKIICTQNVVIKSPSVQILRQLLMSNWKKCNLQKSKVSTQYYLNRRWIKMTFNCWWSMIVDSYTNNICNCIFSTILSHM